MKNLFHKFATYSALVLISSLPFPIDSFAEVEKKTDSVSVKNAERHTPTGRHNTASARQNRRNGNNA